MGGRREGAEWEGGGREQSGREEGGSRVGREGGREQSGREEGGSRVGGREGREQSGRGRSSALPLQLCNLSSFEEDDARLVSLPEVLLSFFL